MVLVYGGISPLSSLPLFACVGVCKCVFAVAHELDTLPDYSTSEPDCLTAFKL